MSGQDLWVFGYGSLMWRPGFDYDERARARLTGYRRCFCVYSTHHRGTAERPGMVLGLDRGGTCDGIAYRVGPRRAAEVLAYLREREQVNGVYREVAVALLLPETHRTVEALAYVAERTHPSYAGRLALGVQATLIRGARGLSGPNLDYLINTVEHLAELGIRERELERLSAIVGPLFGNSAALSDTGGRPGSKALLAAARCHCVPVRRMRPGDRRRFTHRRQIAAWDSIQPKAP